MTVAIVTFNHIFIPKGEHMPYKTKLYYSAFYIPFLNTAFILVWFYMIVIRLLIVSNIKNMCKKIYAKIKKN